MVEREMITYEWEERKGGGRNVIGIMMPDGYPTALPVTPDLLEASERIKASFLKLYQHDPRKYFFTQHRIGLLECPQCRRQFTSRWCSDQMEMIQITFFFACDCLWLDYSVPLEHG